MLSQNNKMYVEQCEKTTVDLNLIVLSQIQI